MEVDFDHLLELKEDDLYEALGRQIQHGTLGATTKSPDENRLFGQNWIARRRSDLSAKICQTQVVKTYRSSKRIQDRAILAAAIVDLIATIVSGVPATTVAVLLVKEGLDTLCDTK